MEGVGLGGEEEMGELFSLAGEGGEEEYEGWWAR